MKILNIDPGVIIEFYFKEIRSVCEMACQAFQSGLKKNQTKDIGKNPEEGPETNPLPPLYYL